MPELRKRQRGVIARKIKAADRDKVGYSILDYIQPHKERLLPGGLRFFSPDSREMREYEKEMVGESILSSLPAAKSMEETNQRLAALQMLNSAISKACEIRESDVIDIHHVRNHSDNPEWRNAFIAEVAVKIKQKTGITFYGIMRGDVMIKKGYIFIDSKSDLAKHIASTINSFWKPKAAPKGKLRIVK